MNILLIYVVGLMITSAITGFVVGENIPKDTEKIMLTLLGVFFWPIGIFFAIMVGLLELGRITREKLWP